MRFETSRIRRVIRNLRKTIELAWAASPRALVKYSVVGIVNAAIAPLIVFLGATLVDRLARAQLTTMHFSDVLPIVVGLWVATVAQRALASYMTYGRNLYVRRVELEAERQLLAKASTIDLGHFDDSDWHDRLARAKREVAWRPGDLTWSLLGLSGNLVSFVLMAGLLARLHYFLVFLALAAAILSLLIEHQIAPMMYEFYYHEAQEEREREYFGGLLTEPSKAKEIRSYALAGYLLERHRRLSEALYSRRVEVHRWASRMVMNSGLVTGTALALAYSFVASRGLARSIDVGGIVLVIGAFTSVSSTLGQISGAFLAIDQHTSFLDDYFSFMSIEPLVLTTSSEKTWPSECVTHIEFDDVWFSYPGGVEPAVTGLTLRIHPGELVALVGDNGAGKSTVVKLLLRLYDVGAGSVRVGGLDVKDWTPAALRSRIGVLFQDYVSYELTLRENVAIGRPEGATDDARVMQALRDAQCDGLLRAMPKGLDAKVGRLFEGGRDLSGGEWQRLALARLMYRNAAIWILDEPTSSLDPEAEAAVFAELKLHLRGRIGIVISHRFSTVRVADRIIVLANGHVTEQGTHEELLLLHGHYARLFESQAAGYR